MNDLVNFKSIIKKLFLMLFLLPSISSANEAWICNIRGELLFKDSGNHIDVYVNDIAGSLVIVKRTDTFIFAERVNFNDELESYYFIIQDGSVKKVHRYVSKIKELRKDEYIDLRIKNTIMRTIENPCL